MKKVISIFLSLVLVFTVGTSALAATPITSNDQELYSLADEYGFEIEYIQHNTTRQSSNVTPVAKFDSVEDFKEALANGDYQLPSTMLSNSKPIEVAEGEISPESAISTRAVASGNRNIASIIAGLDLCATISYTYNTVNSNREYTDFTNFVTFFNGFNIGYSFDLTTWNGTVCSDVYYENGTWYYVSASQGPGYYITWGGNLSWGIEVGGSLLGVSDYIDSWFMGIGDFSNM